MALMLALQLTGSMAHADREIRQDGSEAASLAALSSAIDQPVVLCTHGGGEEPDQGTPERCVHCVICHVLPAAVPPLGDVTPSTDALFSKPAYFAAIAGLHFARYASGSSPRGPPNLS